MESVLAGESVIVPTDELDDFRTYLSLGKEHREAHKLLASCELPRGAGRGGNSLTLLLMGVTHHGKSSLLNLLFGYTKALTARDMSSTTRKPDLYTHDKVRGLYFVDCPGLFDSRGPEKDRENAADLKAWLEENRTPDGILLVCKFSDSQSGVMHRVMSTAREMRATYGCNILVVLTFANSKNLQLLPSAETEFRQLMAKGEKRQAKHVRWRAWKDEKIKQIREGLGEDANVVLIENDEACKVNEEGEKILLDGTPWVPHLVHAILQLSKESAQKVAEGISHSEDAEVRQAVQFNTKGKLIGVIQTAAIAGAATGLSTVWGAMTIASEGGVVASAMGLGGGLTASSAATMGASGALLGAVPVLVIGGLGVVAAASVYHGYQRLMEQTKKGEEDAEASNGR